MSEAQRLSEKDGVRATTAFNRLLALPGARAIDVAFAPEEIMVRVEAVPWPSRLTALG